MIRRNCIGNNKQIDAGINDSDKLNLEHRDIEGHKRRGLWILQREVTLINK
jgi:hypothetical protein